MASDLPVHVACELLHLSPVITLKPHTDPSMRTRTFAHETYTSPTPTPTPTRTSTRTRTPYTYPHTHTYTQREKEGEGRGRGKGEGGRQGGRKGGRVEGGKGGREEGRGPPTCGAWPMRTAVRAALHSVLLVAAGFRHPFPFHVSFPAPVTTELRVSLPAPLLGGDFLLSFLLARSRGFHYQRRGFLCAAATQLHGGHGGGQGIVSSFFLLSCGSGPRGHSLCWWLIGGGSGVQERVVACSDLCDLRLDLGVQY